MAVDFNPSGIGITVDRQEKTITLPSGGNRYLDLADTLYIGGTELNKRARALGKGLKSGDVSYKGCLRSMLLDNKELGLPDVKISQGIVVGCVWGFPCIEADPCVPEAVCSQLGVSSFKCDCDQPLCIKSNYAEDYKVNVDQFPSTTIPLTLPLLSHLFFLKQTLKLKIHFLFRFYFITLASFIAQLQITPIVKLPSIDLLEVKFAGELGDALAESSGAVRGWTRAGDER